MSRMRNAPNLVRYRDCYIRHAAASRPVAASVFGRACCFALQMREPPSNVRCLTAAFAQVLHIAIVMNGALRARLIRRNR